MVIVHQNIVEEMERHILTADIIEAWNEIDEVSDVLCLDHKVHFDPRQFASENPAPQREVFELNEEERHDWGCRCARLRERIKNRAES